MSTAPQEIQVSPSGGNGCLKFGLIGCGLLLVLGIVGAIVVYLNFKPMMANMTRAVIEQAIEEQNIPEEQKRAIMKEVDQLTEDFKADKISLEDLGRVFEELAESPLLGVGAVMVVDGMYIKKSGLSPEEREEGTLSVERFARGIVERSIDKSELDSITAIVFEGEGENMKLKQELTDEELRQLLATCKEQADAANVPNERYEVDLAAELKKAIDKALGRDPEASSEAAEPAEAK